MKGKKFYCKKCSGLIFNRRQNAIYCKKCADEIMSVNRKVFNLRVTARKRKERRLSNYYKQRRVILDSEPYAQLTKHILFLSRIKAVQQRLAKPDWERVIEADMLIHVAMRQRKKILRAAGF